MNRDEFLLECPEPCALPDRSETLDRRPVRAYPNSIFGEMTEKRGPIASEASLFPGLEGALDSRHILCRDWGRIVLRRLECRLAPSPLPAAAPLHEHIGNAARPGDIPFGRALNGLPSRQDRDVAVDSDLEIGEFRIRPLHVARHGLGYLLRLGQHRPVRVGVEVIVTQESLEGRTVLLELGIRGGLLEFDDFLLCRTCRLSPGSTAGEQT